MNNIPEGATHESNGLYYKSEGGSWYYWYPVQVEWKSSLNDLEWHKQCLNTIGAAHDTVNSPKHYQLLPGVEVYGIRQALAAKATVAGATLDQFSDYDRAVEYLLRMWEKNGVEDAKKAAWYLNKLVEKLSDDRP